MLVIGLVGDGPAAEKRRGIDLRLFRDAVGVVVVDFVVIPGDDPRDGGVHRLQGGVGLVLRVPIAIVVERLQFFAHMPANLPDSPRPLIDVVAQVNDQVGVLSRHVLVGGVEPRFEVLARGDAKAEAGGECPSSRGGAGASPRAFLPEGPELVPVPAVGLKSRDLDVDAVGPLRGCHGGPLLYDLCQLFIVGDHPVDSDVFAGHAAPFEGLGGQSRPQHSARFGRIARGDPEGEERLGDGERSTHHTQRPARPEGGTGQVGQPNQQLATRWRSDAHGLARESWGFPGCPVPGCPVQVHRSGFTGPGVPVLNSGPPTTGRQRPPGSVAIAV